MTTCFSPKKMKKNINLNAIERYLKNNEMFAVNYNQELFPGMRLLPKDKKYPTIGLFGSGSFTMIGSTGIVPII